MLQEGNPVNGDRDLSREFASIAKPHINRAVFDALREYRRHYGRKRSCQCWPNPCPSLSDICEEVARAHLRQVGREALSKELKLVLISPYHREYWRQLLRDILGRASEALKNNPEYMYYGPGQTYVPLGGDSVITVRCKGCGSQTTIMHSYIRGQPRCAGCGKTMRVYASKDSLVY
jgi:hypothetical protein